MSCFVLGLVYVVFVGLCGFVVGRGLGFVLFCGYLGGCVGRGFVVYLRWVVSVYSFLIVVCVITLWVWACIVLLWVSCVCLLVDLVFVVSVLFRFGVLLVL